MAVITPYEPSCIAGITCETPISAVLSTPQRTFLTMLLLDGLDNNPYSISFQSFVSINQRGKDTENGCIFASLVIQLILRFVKMRQHIRGYTLHLRQIVRRARQIEDDIADTFGNQRFHMLDQLRFSANQHALLKLIEALAFAIS